MKYNDISAGLLEFLESLFLRYIAIFAALERRNSLIHVPKYILDPPYLSLSLSLLAD